MKDLAHSTASTTKRGSQDFHAECFACAPAHEQGLRLHFDSNGINTTCRAEIGSVHQSYDGIVHGGIIATLLDATMIRCLHSAFGGNPLTCRMDIRYREVVPIYTGITISACVTSRRGTHCWVHATITQNDRLCVTARGTFKLVGSMPARATRLNEP
ncbi:MAG: PaaI family thioesterase [Ignavibacteriales bacterium]|nr:PaaI family thioesterase [Ignavibacteriales bacterium]